MEWPARPLPLVGDGGVSERVLFHGYYKQKEVWSRRAYAQ